MRGVFLAPDLVACQRQSYDLSNAELERLREREMELGTGRSSGHVSRPPAIHGPARSERPSLRSINGCLAR